jgi:hypothetical protein
MLSGDSMFDVDESTNESNSSGEHPIVSYEPDEDEVEHEPFEFPHDDKIPYSRLLFDSMVWRVQGSNNGNGNLDMPFLNNNVQVSNVPPLLYMLQWPQIKTCPCNQWVPWKWTPQLTRTYY